MGIGHGEGNLGLLARIHTSARIQVSDTGVVSAHKLTEYLIVDFIHRNDVAEPFEDRVRSWVRHRAFIIDRFNLRNEAGSS